MKWMECTGVQIAGLLIDKSGGGGGACEWQNGRVLRALVGCPPATENRGLSVAEYANSHVYFNGHRHAPCCRGSWPWPINHWFLDIKDRIQDEIKPFSRTPSVRSRFAPCINQSLCFWPTIRYRLDQPGVLALQMQIHFKQSRDNIEHDQTKVCEPAMITPHYGRPAPCFDLVI